MRALTPRQFLYALSLILGALLHSKVLIGVFLAVSWVVSAYFWPHAPCLRCNGRKVRKGSSSKRFGLCPRCGGTGSRQVIGSKQVHKAVLSMAGYRNDRKKGN